MKKIIITEEERKKILKMHESLKEQVNKKDYVNMDRIQATTVQPTPKQEGGTKLDTPLQIKLGTSVSQSVGDFLVTLTSYNGSPTGCDFYGTVRQSNDDVIIRFSCTLDTVNYFLGGAEGKGDGKVSAEALSKMKEICGCSSFVKNQSTNDGDYA